MDLKPTVISSPHPLLSDGRQYSYATFLKGETLGQYVIRNDIQIPRSGVVVFSNGVRVSGDWTLLIPQSGDQIIIRTRARGGDSGKVFRLVAMVALAVFAPYASGTLLGLTGTAASLTTAGIMIAGSMLINALLPPPKPAQLGNKERESSPTYGINGGRNQLSPYSPMILVMGRHKVVPYYGSKYYTTFSGNDQFLSQVFHFGLQPELEISDIKIGDTLIDNYQDVEINRSGYDGKLTLVAGNVDTLDGFDLAQPDGWIMRTTPDDTEFISADIAAQVYRITDEGDYRDETVQVEAQYSVAGANNWKPLGGYYETRATHYWSLGSWVMKKQFPSGDMEQVWQQLEYGSTVSTDHTEMQPEQRCAMVFDWLSGGQTQRCTTYYWRWLPHPAAGWKKKPWQGIAPDPVTVYSGTGISDLTGSDPQKPARQTMEAKVAKGQYDIRFRKVTGDISTNQRSNKVSVAQIRCTQTDNADYTNQCRVAVRIKATSQLNGAIDQLSAICTAKCHVWKNNAWVEEFTQNPAWWYLWFARGMRDQNYDRLYGECLPDSKIDIEAIKAWAAYCDQKNLTFNFVLDRKMSIEDVFYTIARAGRASVTHQSGKRGVIWDSADIPVTTLVTPANIIAGSYSYKYINTEVADEIIINFVNADKDYEKDVVRQIVPGTARVNNPITLDLEGAVYVDMVGREANLLAASQHFHRKQHKWEMDLEGMICTRGDVVQFTHDLNSWGKSGRVLSINGSVLILDGYVEPSAGWLSLRAPDNTIAYVRTLASGTELTDTLTISGGWPASLPLPDDNAIDYIWQYSPTATPGKKLHIKSVRPKSNGNVEFEAIEYSAEYYASENDPYAHIGNAKPRASLINVFSISASERIVDEVSGTVDVTFTWVLSEKSASDVTIYINGNPFDSFRTPRYMATVSAREGDIIDIDVYPTQDSRGVLKRYQYTVRGTLFVIPAVASLTATSEVYAIRLNWTIPSVNYIERTEIWYSITPDLVTAQKLSDIAYPQQEYRQAGIRAGQEFYYWVRLVDRFGNIGEFYPTGNGVYGVSSTDVNAYMELFKDEFVSSAVGQQLQDEIDIINGDAFTEGSIAAAVKAESDERMDSDIALAEALETVEAIANGAAASAQTNATAIAGVDGRLSSTITTKVQILANGQRVIAGTGLGIEHTPDQGFQSSFNVWADRFAVWSGNGTDLFSPFVVSGGQVFINDAVIGTLSADKIGAGIYDVGRDGYGVVRTKDKVWRDGTNGFFFEGQPNGTTAMEMNAGGNNYFWLHHDAATNSSTGAININNAFYADHTGYMRINAVDVSGRLQLRDDSVTTMNHWSPSGWSNAPGQKWSVNLGEGAGAMVAYNLRVEQTGGLLNMAINLILNGVVIGRVDKINNPSSGWQCWAGSFPSNATLQITHEGGGAEGNWWLDVSVLKRFK
ncbi:MAG: host specificity factor TipJ family phage tail protein [Advenella sp.]|uniref:host specificity protein J n=1 Tax=Advenella sp. TaxID=1872388 RepID=UPI00258FD10A|nr:host specificity factor TipJ family phage tail protein [Advenella sp.]MDD3757711.1 host specificity factor TipJ family phage tail protein [Advenella sp.]